MVIENVIVKSACRGRGIGVKLMEGIEEIGRKREGSYSKAKKKAGQLLLLCDMI